MHLIRKLIVLAIFVLLIEGFKRHRFDIRNGTRKSLSNRAQKDFDNTVNGLNRINNLQRRLMGIKNKTVNENEEIEVTNESSMENPNLFQGDIMLTENQVNDIVSDIVKQAEDKKIDVSDIEDKRNLLKRNKRSITKSGYDMWTSPISYYIDTGVDANLISTALKGIEDDTCIRFTKSATPITGKPGLRFYLGDGCWSYIGRISSNSSQDVSIGRGCGLNGIVQHETAHALGVYHEQSRPDRDTFVTVKAENVIAGLESNFYKNSLASVNDFGIPYDYGSVMHYRRFDFSKNGDLTIIPSDRKYDKTMGQRNKLLFNDVKLINFKYCNSTCVTKITCKNGGYQNPNNCQVCKCPLGFYGPVCQNYVTSPSTGCGNQYLSATTAVQTLQMIGALNCYYFINTTANYHVKLNVVTANLVKNDPCYSGKGLEIKYKTDKTETGINFCGVNKNQAVTSESESVLIHYVGSGAADNFTLTYTRL